MNLTTSNDNNNNDDKQNYEFIWQKIAQHLGVPSSVIANGHESVLEFINQKENFPMHIEFILAYSSIGSPPPSLEVSKKETEDEETVSATVSAEKYWSLSYIQKILPRKTIKYKKVEVQRWFM